MQGHRPVTRQPVLMSTSLQGVLRGLGGRKAWPGTRTLPLSRPGCGTLHLSWLPHPGLSCKNQPASLHSEVLGADCQPKDSPCLPLHRHPGQTVASQASAMCRAFSIHSWLHGTCLPRLSPVWVCAGSFYALHFVSAAGASCGGLPLGPGY